METLSDVLLAHLKPRQEVYIQDLKLFSELERIWNLKLRFHLRRFWVVFEDIPESSAWTSASC